MASKKDFELYAEEIFKRIEEEILIDYDLKGYQLVELKYDMQAWSFRQVCQCKDLNTGQVKSCECPCPCP